MLYCPGNVAYGTSKAAVAYMTKQIGSEYIQDGIVVNAVAPGRILTGREVRTHTQPHEDILWFSARLKRP